MGGELGVRHGRVPRRGGTMGVDGVPHFAKLLTTARSANEQRAALDAITTVLREPAMEIQRRMAEDVAVPAMLPLLEDRRYFVRGRCMDALR